MVSLVARSCSTARRAMHGLLPVLLLPVLLLAVGASGCLRKERDALLAFKAGLTDPGGRLASWSGGSNCCRWYGVTCSNNTGRVVKLDLNNDPEVDQELQFALSGAIDPSLVSLAHLEYIDLKWNDFSGTSIPGFIGSLNNLRHLDLSCTWIGGEIPPQLGNLSRLSYLDISDTNFSGASIPGFIGSLNNLRHLDLSDTGFGGEIPPQLGNLSRLSYLDIGGNTGASVSSGGLHWLGRLSSLTHLGLSGCNLSAASGWLESVSMLSSLQVLLLSIARLPPTDLNSLSQANFTDLNEIDLSYNYFSSSFPYWLTNLRNVSSVTLAECGLHGRIPESLGNLTSLHSLDLSSNNLEGEIPGSIGALCNLKVLFLTDNNLTGDVANIGKAMARCMNQLDAVDFRSNSLTGRLSGWFESFTDPNSSGKLSHLSDLCLSHNSLHGTLTEQHLANLPNLFRLALSGKSLRIAVDINWVPPFRLNTLELHSCQLESQFPHWLRTQTGIRIIDLHDTGIVGPIPDWVWTSSTSLWYLDLSNNVLTGKLPASLVHLKNLQTLILNSNQLEGQIPDMPDNIVVISLSNNSFSGSLPHNFNPRPVTEYILLSSNRLNGSIPRFFCDMTKISILDLSNNSLSGGLPNCWKQNRNILVLDFSSNNLEGEIPPSIGSLTRLRWLQLNKNKLSGMLPSSLQSCKALSLLDIGENHFTGPVPAWIGKSLESLRILRLRSNQFCGNIPANLSQLQWLQVLDLGNNKLSGTLPHFLGNFTAMASQQSLQSDPIVVFYEGGRDVNDFSSKIYVTTKGEERMYSTILYLMMSIDLSDNELTGEIPTEIGALVALKNLNLSRNHLSGSIPMTIGRMLQLESLDLSRNHLSGVIPQTLASLDSLESLNLSYNNLSGKIPPGSHLQTLGDQDPYIYAGNKYLCSPLASESCSEDKSDHPLDHGERKDDRDVWLDVFSGLGFGLGFAAVWWLLVFSKAASKVYFKFIDSTYEKICDWVVLLKIKVNTKLAERNQDSDD